MNTIMIKNVAVIGIGGVGGYFGGKLCQIMSSDSNIHIYFVARGPHLQEIRKNGLLLATAEEGNLICKPTLATDRFGDLPTLDLCLFCVKSYDLARVLTEVRGVASQETLIVPLLNGVDVYERIRAVVPGGYVFPSCVYIGAYIEKPGRVTQKGGRCKILFGKDPQYRDIIPHEVFHLLERTHIRYQWVEDPYPEIWEKFIFIAAFGLVTACFRKSMGQVMESAELSNYVLSIMKEIVVLARREGIALREAIVEDSFNKGGDFPYETKTSLQRDFERADKLDERDLFGGTILRLAKSLGVDVPITSSVYGRLQGMKDIAS
jgi:2-dehydropantoate 2-reductase